MSARIKSAGGAGSGGRGQVTARESAAGSGLEGPVDFVGKMAGVLCSRQPRCACRHLVGSGTMSNSNYREGGFLSITERRAIESHDLCKPVTPFTKLSDTVDRSADLNGQSVFRSICQRVVPPYRLGPGVTVYRAMAGESRIQTDHGSAPGRPNPPVEPVRIRALAYARFRPADRWRLTGCGPMSGWVAGLEPGVGVPGAPRPGTQTERGVPGHQSHSNLRQLPCQAC